MPNLKWTVPAALLVAGVFASIVLIGALRASASAFPPNSASSPKAADQYVVLTWNDLGMHCYNWDFSDLAVLPPYNTLWAQVVKVGNPPQVITAGIQVTYYFTNNTYSVGKSNFWTYAQKLFGLGAPLPPNIGLTGRGLTGTMSASSDHFVAEGIPLTEFSDSAPTTRDPYQLARIVARDLGGNLLAENTVVAPVSTEMHCDNCHYDGGVEGIRTGKVERNILTLHDQEEGTNLIGTRPVLCASCHSSNALGAPGKPGVPSLSNAMHNRHKEEVPSTLDGCYNCHPGPTTRCLRDVMSSRFSMDCISCHGTLAQVAQNPNPWLNEPRCDTCHNSGNFNQNQPLYRFSKGHGGIYCEACHDSTHAIAQSTQPRDALKFIALQGHAGTLDTCTVCHTFSPTGPGPHNIKGPNFANFSFTPPQRSSVQDPGDEVVYQHVLYNTGNVTDTYTMTWSSSQQWATVSVDGVDITSPTTRTLAPDRTAAVNVTLRVPNLTSVLNLTDTTRVTVTSWLSPSLPGRVTDTTAVPLRIGFTFDPPNRSSAPNPGEQVVYTHTLVNTGNISDTFHLNWSHTQSWTTLSVTFDGGTVSLPAMVTLEPSRAAVFTVTVTIPSGTATIGMVDTTLITATSTVSSTTRRVTDTTLVPRARMYLPIVQRN